MKITDHDRITDIDDNDVMLVDGERGTKIASIASFIDKILSRIGFDIPISIENGGTGATSAAEARAGLGLATPIPLKNGGTGATTAAAARTALGLGAAATLPSPIPLKNGGTGATAAAAARTNLGLGAASTYGVTTSVTSGSTALVTSGGVYNSLPARFINTGSILKTISESSTTKSWKATANCYVHATSVWGGGENVSDAIYIDGVAVSNNVYASPSGSTVHIGIYTGFLKKGQTISTNGSWFSLRAMGLTI